MVDLTLQLSQKMQLEQLLLTQATQNVFKYCRISTVHSTVVGLLRRRRTDVFVTTP